MDAEIVEATLKMHVKKMRDRLDRAAGIAKAAEACADAGNIEKGYRDCARRQATDL